MTVFGMNWSEVLGPLGLEAPGFQECMKDCRENPWTKPGKKKAKTKSKGKQKKAGG